VALGGLTKVLVISASMGAGHDGAAREVAARLRAAGHDAEVRDFLDSGPLRIGSALRRGYEFELKHVPSAYEATYRLWYRVPWLCPVVAWLVTVLTRRRVLRWVDQLGADAVVSTYPLATLCLGRLRTMGWLDVPAVNFITDFGVHPLWVHPGVDVNLAVHRGPAEMAAFRTGRPSIACGPAVSAAFDRDALPSRQSARAALGLRPDDRAVLIVAGSWGVGGVESTWRAVTSDPRLTPVIVCGTDDRLRAQVAALAGGRPGQPTRPDSIVLGWTDAMPALMSACDVLVENAGGLTSLEAMRAGLPVVSFQPIAGHGRENTRRMAAAGVSRLAADREELVRSVLTLTSDGPARDEQVERAQAMFRSDPAELVLATAGLPRTAAPGPRPIVATARAAAALLAVAAMGWAALTSGVEVAAAAAGVGVAHPAPGVSGVAYVGVRLDRAELVDPSIRAELARMHLTAVVDRATAMAEPAALRALVGLGVGVANGGRGDWSAAAGGDHDPMLWTRAKLDATAGHQLAQLTGTPVTVFVPGRRVNAWDLIECRDTHSSLVVPDHILNAFRTSQASGPIHVTARRIYLVNGLGADPAQLADVLGRLGAGLAVAHLSAAPLAALA
jgi:UDP-N-acetylglucosamine:LPS N-acetylglucosamine transferase